VELALDGRIAAGNRTLVSDVALWLRKSPWAKLPTLRDGAAMASKKL
jgi:hypothetical protein